MYKEFYDRKIDTFENCGIIQLSAWSFRMVQHKSKLTSEIERECFDEYAMPSNDAIWDER